MTHKESPEHSTGQNVCGVNMKDLAEMQISARRVSVLVLMGE